MPKEKAQNRSGTDWAESGKDMAEFAARMVPWIGQPIKNVLNGISIGQKMPRVNDLLEGVINEIIDFRSELSELYVKTDDFGKFLDNILRIAADERVDEKRNIYKNFLLDAIKSPCEPFDRQLELLQSLKELRGDHLRLLGVLLEPMRPDVLHSTTLFKLLHKNLPDLPHDRIEGLHSQLVELKVIKSSDSDKTVRPGSPNPANCLTPLGQRLVRLINLP
jgi:hypothetical protein